MRIAEVIGTVTLSQPHPSLVGARWLIAVPFSAPALRQGGKADGVEEVIYDDLGAGLGSRVAFNDGVQAARAFYPQRKPLDAYCAAILDKIAISDQQSAVSSELTVDC
jgi:ethanolamine utilization protein EutN